MSSIDLNIFISFTYEATTYNWSSVEGILNGTWYTPLISDFPKITETSKNAYGIQEVSSFSISVVDSDNTIYDLVSNPNFLSTEVTVTYKYNDSTKTKVFIVTGFEKTEAEVKLSLIERRGAILQNLYPSAKYNATDWPNIYTEDVGQVVSDIIGVGLKIPAAFLDKDESANDWFYGLTSDTGATVLTVYRDGRIVDASEYTTEVRNGILGIAFSQEQVDFSNSLYSLTADVEGSRSNNIVTEIKYLLNEFGLSTDSTSFSEAETYATNNEMFVDFAYKEQRTLRAILSDLLMIARASLVVDELGNFKIIQDKAKTASYYFDAETDLIDISSIKRANLLNTIDVVYGPKLEYTNTRTVSTSGTDSERFEFYYIKDHTTADRLADFLAKKQLYNLETSATIYNEFIELGDVVEITSYLWGNTLKEFLVTRASYSDANTQVSLLEVNSDIYTYSAGTLPDNATEEYRPDYSSTPPEAPTSVSVVSEGTSVDTDGKVSAWAKVQGIPPTTNWSEIWFVIENTNTNELYVQKGSEDGSYYSTTIPGLRPNSSHRLSAYAVNSFGVEGAASSYDYFTSNTDNTVPNTPSGVDASQGTGKTIKVTWGGVSDADLDYYEVQRDVNSTSGFTTVDKVRGESYVDTNVYYGSTYYYRVRAVDRSGNTSGWSSYNSEYLSKTVGNTDLDSADQITYDKIYSVSAEAINAGTITGATFRTSATGRRWELSTATQSGKYIGSDGAVWSEIGYVTEGTGGETVCGKFGHSTMSSSVIALMAYGGYNSVAAKVVNGHMEVVNGDIVVEQGRWIRLNGLGSSWPRMECPGYGYIDLDMDGTVKFRFSNDGNLYRSTDGGANWTPTTWSS